MEKVTASAKKPNVYSEFRITLWTFLVAILKCLPQRMFKYSENLQPRLFSAILQSKNLVFCFFDHH